MAGKPPSIGDIISQFAIPPQPPASPAQEWLGELSKWLSESYEALVHAERAPGLHASGLGEVCARREVITHAFGAPKKSKTAGNQLTYGFGHAMHFWWQHRYLGPKGELWGNWMCTACLCPTCKGSVLDKLAKVAAEKRVLADDESCVACMNTGRKITQGFMPMECDCKTPWQDSIRYMEMPVENKKLGYVGHCDGILIRNKKNPKKRTVFEFKTDGPTNYDDRKEPDIKHVIQAHAYMEPLGIKEALIVYQAKAKQCEWSKDGGQWIAGDVHVKPYLIQFDPVIWGPVEQRIKDHHAARELIQQIMNEGRHTTRDDIAKFKRVCESQRCQLARDCPVASQCFSLS